MNPNDSLNHQILESFDIVDDAFVMVDGELDVELAGPLFDEHEPQRLNVSIRPGIVGVGVPPQDDDPNCLMHVEPFGLGERNVDELRGAWDDVERFAIVAEGSVELRTLEQVPVATLTPSGGRFEGLVMFRREDYDDDLELQIKISIWPEGAAEPSAIDYHRQMGNG